MTRPTIARSLIRLICHSQNIDVHVFLFGHDDPSDATAWQAGLNQLSEACPDLPLGDWIAQAWQRHEIHGGRHHATYHQDGWMIQLRHDRIDPRRAAAAVNDNDIAQSVESKTTKTL